MSSKESEVSFGDCTFVRIARDNQVFLINERNICFIQEDDKQVVRIFTRDSPGDPYIFTYDEWRNATIGVLTSTIHQGKDK